MLLQFQHLSFKFKLYLIRYEQVITQIVDKDVRMLSIVHRRSIDILRCAQDAFRIFPDVQRCFQMFPDVFGCSLDVHRSFGCSLHVL